MTEETKFHVELNCETGEETIREFTPEEYAQAAAEAAAFAEKQAIREAELAAKAEAKASAEAKLTAIGLTPEEIAALSN